jgi:integrase
LTAPAAFSLVRDAETMDSPIVEYSEQKRPSLKAKTISDLIAASSGQEQALYVLLAATGLRISEALAIETRHFINGGRTITRSSGSVRRGFVAVVVWKT